MNNQRTNNNSSLNGQRKNQTTRGSDPLTRELSTLLRSVNSGLAQASQASSNQSNRRRNRGRSKAKLANLPSQSVRDQIGAVVQTRLTQVGLSDIKSHRQAWVIGYTYVGDGTNGIADSVYFQCADSTPALSKLNAGYVASTSTGLVPILGSDSVLGRSYIADIDKHYAKKVVRRMWIHVDSLQPSTANNMMAVIAPRRGAAACYGANDFPIVSATTVANSIPNVSSMKEAFTIDSWESKWCEITQFIAGGSGPKQNEFEIGSLTNSSTVTQSANQDLDGVAPAEFAVAGNSTTTTLRGTRVHQISIVQEVDLLDYIGGQQQLNPVE